MLLRALLVVLFVFSTLFVWRGWRSYPGLSIVAALVAAVTGALLVNSPFLGALGFVAVAVLIYFASRTKH